MQTPPPSLIDRFNNRMKNSVTVKLIAIAFLILLLLIPSSMVNDLIYERLNLRDEAVKEVSAKWGDEQVITGPVISIPYRYTYKTDEGKLMVGKSNLHFLPDQLNINGDVIPEKRHRGIYIVVLYKGKFKIKGSFPKTDLAQTGVVASDLYLNEASVSLGITDMKGIKTLNLKLNENTLNTEPGVLDEDIFSSGIHTNLEPDLLNQALAFDIDLELNGSSAINFAPFGKETNVHLTSKWGDPKFQGDFLPNHTTTPQGFTADWKVLQLNRNYPQKGQGEFIKNVSDFGVRLLLPVDEYQKTIRSSKYGLMFIVITFLSFFFIEIINKKPIHTIQYLLVGFAIVLFYVLLLSISEHLSFDMSYLISTVSILALITSYVYFLFRNIMLTGIFSGILTLLYGFFYSLLQLQDYALLMGSIGLFIILAVIMYLTRNIDWYNLNTEES
jgi:inner membrane protein